MNEQKRRHDASRSANLRGRRITLSQLLGPGTTGSLLPRRPDARGRLVLHVALGLTCFALILLAVGVVYLFQPAQAGTDGPPRPVATAPASNPVPPPPSGTTEPRPDAAAPDPVATPAPDPAAPSAPDPAPGATGDPAAAGAPSTSPDRLPPSPVAERSRMAEAGTTASSLRAATSSRSARALRDGEGSAAYARSEPLGRHRPSHDSDTRTPGAHHAGSGPHDSHHDDSHDPDDPDDSDDSDDGDQICEVRHDQDHPEYDCGLGAIIGGVGGTLEELLGRGVPRP